MIAFLLVFALLEGSGIIKRKERKEILTVTVLLLLSLAYGLDYTLQLNLLPDPKALVYRLSRLTEQYEAFFNIRY